MKDVPSRTDHCMFWVTRARLDVRLWNSEVESRASRPALAPADPYEEAREHEGAEHDEGGHQRQALVRRHDPADEDHQPGC